MRLMLITTAVLLGGCVATSERPMNYGEKTLLSQNVEQRLDENEGLLDIREHQDIRCRRIRTVGSHMVKRHCYTAADAEESADRNRRRTEDLLNQTPRPRGAGIGGG